MASIRTSVTVLVLSALLAGCGGGGDDDDAARGAVKGPERTETTAGGAEDAPGGDEDGGAEGTSPTNAAGGRTPTTARGAAAGSGSAGAKGAAAPAAVAKAPAPGSYRYRLDEGAEPREAPTIVTQLPSPPGETLQQIESDSGNGKLANEVAWRGDSLVVLSSTFKTAQGDFKCDWTPDIAEVPYPIAKGRTWAIESGCDTTISGQPSRISRSARRTVDGSDTRTVGGEPVAVWLISGTDKITIRVGPEAAPAFNQVVDAFTKAELSPEHGLEVLSTTVTTPPGSSRPRTFTRELLSLRPS